MILSFSADILVQCCSKLDGKTIATAASQMKIFNSDHKKIQKCTGHPVCSTLLYLLFLF